MHLLALENLESDPPVQRDHLQVCGLGGRKASLADVGLERRHEAVVLAVGSDNLSHFNALGTFATAVAKLAARDGWRVSCNSAPGVAKFKPRGRLKGGSAGASTLTLNKGSEA